MAKRPGTNVKNEWAFFDVVYEDGSQRSNRRVPLALLGGIEQDAPARGYPRLGPLDQLRPAESSEARPAARGQFRVAGLGAGGLGALFADGWGPAWRFAAAAGLPPHGPLTLPGVWNID